MQKPDRRSPGRKLAGDAFEPFSAGTEKQDHLDPGAVKWMKELHGVDMEKTQRSKTLRDIPAADIVILMGCGIACPAMKAAYEENWGLTILPGNPGRIRENYKNHRTAHSGPEREDPERMEITKS